MHRVKKILNRRSLACAPRGVPWACVVALSTLLSACQPAVLDPIGPIGSAEKTILINSLAIMLAVVVPTIVATLGMAWWFRASNKRAHRRPEWAFSGRIELVVWAVPLMVILLLGGVTWIGAHQLDPARPIESELPVLNIQVVSLDWKWLFIYPDQRVATVNQLIVPVSVPLHFSLTSASVMNTFFIPQLGSMIYTMNGMTTQLNLQADQVGTVRGISGHYSGEGFSDMHFPVHIVPPAAFARWVDTTARGTEPVLDDAHYAALAKQGVPLAPSAYRSVAGGLYQRIATQAMPPASGPAPGAAGAMQQPLLAH